LKKWTLVAQSLTPDGKTISLNEHDGSYSIRVDGSELMSTRQHASEETLAELACAHLGRRSDARDVQPRSAAVSRRVGPREKRF
jgi:hypothetical protein